MKIGLELQCNMCQLHTGSMLESRLCCYQPAWMPEIESEGFTDQMAARSSNKPAIQIFTTIVELSFTDTAVEMIWYEVVPLAIFRWIQMSTSSNYQRCISMTTRMKLTNTHSTGTWKKDVVWDPVYHQLLFNFDSVRFVHVQIPPFCSIETLSFSVTLRECIQHDGIPLSYNWEKQRSPQNKCGLSWLRPRIVDDCWRLLTIYNRCSQVLTIETIDSHDWGQHIRQLYTPWTLLTIDSESHDWG